MYENSDEHHQHQVGVVVIPLPAQGHLTQLLQLSHLLTTTYRIPVHYLCSATHIQQVKTRAHFTSSEQPPNQTSNNSHAKTTVQFHDIQFLPFTTITETQPNSRSPFPTHLQSILQSLYYLRKPISQFLHSIKTKFRRLIVIHDSMMASVVEDIHSIQNIEFYTHHTSSAFAIFLTTLEFMVEKPLEHDLDDIPTITLPSCQEWSSPEFKNFVSNQYKLLNMSCGRLYNTCYALENKYMDLLKQLPVNVNKKLFAIGPINPFNPSSKTTYCSKSNHRCLEWLDEQKKESVIYVSFGTTTSMSEEQIMELANGLEKSNQSFIWVLREADKVDIFKENNTNNLTVRSVNPLPPGFEDRVKGRGLVVRDWAPQLAILGHPAVGGFVSHCGWNSCIESISMGVPIAAWPIHSDQPKNSILVTQVWKAGVVVRDWTRAGDAVVKSEVIEKAVRKLMSSKEGDEIRGRARKLGIAVQDSISNGGSSCLEMDAFVAHITR